VPTDRSRRTTSRLQLCEQHEVVERIKQRERLQLLSRDLGPAQILLADGASKPSVR
jgi:hypothetical protein